MKGMLGRTFLRYPQKVGPMFIDKGKSMKQSASSKILAVLAIAGVALSGLGMAQDASDSPLAFANADKNGDHYLSRSEVPAQLHDLRAHFDQYDANHDHRLSIDEYRTYLNSVVAGGCKSEVEDAKNPQCRDFANRGMDTPQMVPPPPPPQTKVSN
jgi:hypothetical protein